MQPKESRLERNANFHVGVKLEIGTPFIQKHQFNTNTSINQSLFDSPDNPKEVLHICKEAGNLQLA